MRGSEGTSGSAGIGRTAAAIVFACALSIIPAAAADGYVELESTPATVGVPTLEDGSTNVPVPRLTQETRCEYLPIGYTCVYVYDFDGFDYYAAPIGGVGTQDEEVPFYRAHVWSPVAVGVACSAAGDTRTVHVDVRADLIGRHNYTTLREVGVSTPSDVAVAYLVDVLCGRAGGDVVPEKLLP